MVDIHCHILPFIDDGPSTIKEALQMARIAVQDGISDLVATPHLDREPYDFSRIVRSVEVFNTLLRQEGIPLTIHPGSEVSVSFSPGSFSGFTLGSGNWLLLEFHHNGLPRHAGDLVERYLAAGYRVLLSHPERNPSLIEQPSLLQDLLCCDSVRVQITAGSLCGDFGLEVQCCATHLLENGLVDVIASDAHSSSWRQPRLARGFQVAARYLGRDEAVRLVRDVPRQILASAAVVAA